MKNEKPEFFPAGDMGLISCLENYEQVLANTFMSLLAVERSLILSQAN